MRFDLVRPCGRCPFRTDVAPFIRAGKVREVLGDPDARSRRWWPSESFVCHHTIDYGARRQARKYRKAQHCAGVAIILIRDAVPNTAMQLAERLLGWQPECLDMSAPVYPSRRACIRAHADAE